MLRTMVVAAVCVAVVVVMFPDHLALALAYVRRFLEAMAIGIMGAYGGTGR